jgi:hypothetical protein
MKHLLACVLLLAGIACKSPNGGGGSNSQAIVARVTGMAEFLPTGQTGSWQPIRDGQVLKEGDQARTGADGQVDFRLTPHGGVMTLMPDSAIQFEQLGARGTNQQTVATIRLTKGRVVGDTLKLPKGSKVAVKTNAGTFAIP